ncbi:MAG: long-chain fatty acid--CoA ligase [Bryobacteraceae bacterium]
MARAVTAAAPGHGTFVLMAERTVFTLLEEAASNWGDAPALYEPSRTEESPWRAFSWNEYKRFAIEIAAGLIHLGVRHGDIVAIDSETRAEFYFADLGVVTAGAVSAALYTSYPPAEHVKTLRQLAPKAVFVEDSRTLSALLSAADPPVDARWILLDGQGDPESGADDVLTLAQLRDLGRNAIARDPDLPDRMRSRLRASDNAILYLTSGATGEPKMGLATHAAVVANCDIGAQAVPIGPEDCSIAFLPSAHITQRIAMQMFPLRMGMPVYFSKGLSRLPHELKSVRPTFFVAPPRVWERMYTSICTELKKRPAVTQRIFWFALGVGGEAARRRQRNRSVPMWMDRALAMANRMVFAQIRERLGGRLRMAISGAAPLGRDMADFYAAIGLPIHEGYGLTEGGIVALNPYGQARSGSIGKPLPGVDVKIAEDGEILFQSPTAFAGYYKSPEATAAILRDGWLHTGDVGEFDADGYLYITGRKKEVLVSSNGKKIYPAQIESLFKMEPLINQVLLLGDRQSYVAALFTLNPAVAEGQPGLDAAAEVKRIVQKVNRQLAPFEQIRRYHVMDRDFRIEDGELTPTMKLRRARVIENHREIVSNLFLGKEG